MPELRNRDWAMLGICLLAYGAFLTWWMYFLQASGSQPLAKPKAPEALKKNQTDHQDIAPENSETLPPEQSISLMTMRLTLSDGHYMDFDIGSNRWGPVRRPDTSPVSSPSTAAVSSPTPASASSPDETSPDD